MAARTEWDHDNREKSGNDSPTRQKRLVGSFVFSNSNVFSSTNLIRRKLPTTWIISNRGEEASCLGLSNLSVIYHATHEKAVQLPRGTRDWDWQGLYMLPLAWVHAMIATMPVTWGPSCHALTCNCYLAFQVLLADHVSHSRISTNLHFCFGRHWRLPQGIAGICSMIWS